MRIFQSSGATDKRQLWNEFQSDTEIIARYRITQDELGLLRGMVQVGTFTERRDLLAALRKLRTGGCN